MLETVIIEKFSSYGLWPPLQFNDFFTGVIYQIYYISDIYIMIYHSSEL